MRRSAHPADTVLPQHAWGALCVAVVLTVVSFLASCDLGSVAPQNPESRTPPSLSVPVVDVRIVDFAFVPAVVTFRIGTEVRWTNYGSTVFYGLYMGNAPHTVTFSNVFISGSAPLQHLQSFEKVFTEPGVYHYHCTIHDSMMGTIVVTR
jgi:plastocyanin